MTQKNYTKPELRNRIKSQVMASGDGGKPGQWSARKAQLVAQKYEAAGGGYKGPRTGAQKSLAKWTDQKWTTSDGKPAEKPDGTMRRYLPEKAWDKLTPGQKAATNKKKVEASRKGQQFVANTDAAQEARKEAEAQVLAHIAGPSGSGKTTLGEKLVHKFPSLKVKDLDDFDDQASSELFGNKRKRDYTDQNLQDLARRRQELMDSYLQSHAGAPVVLVGHHTEGDAVLRIPTDNRWMLNTSARVSAERALARSQNHPDHRRKVEDLPFDIREAKDTIKQLRGLKYERRSPGSVLKAIGEKMKPASETKVSSAADAMFAATVLAPVAVAAPLIYYQIGPKGRAQIAREVRDPRLYSNLRHALKSREEAVKAHKNLDRRKDHTVWSAMKEGFGNKISALDPNIFNGFAQQLAEAINEKRASERLKDPEGGLTAAGRRHYEQSGESKDLKPGVKKPVSEMSTKDMKRKGSWARRFYGQSPLPPLKKPNGEPTRLALTARAWGEPVPQNEQQARAIAAKGARLLEMAKRREGEKSSALEPNAFARFARDAMEAAAQGTSTETDDLDPNSAYRDSALHKATGAERSRMNPVNTPPRANYARPPARTLRSV